MSTKERDYQLADHVSDEMQNMYLNFSVGNEIYSIEIRYVLQIIGMQEIVEMPETPSYMKGFIHLRGNVIPVVSMRLRFGKPEEDYTERTCIIVTRFGDKDIGLIVDAIQETITIDPANISPAPSIGEGMNNPYIIGVAGLHGGGVAILVNIQKLFSGQEF